MEPLLTAALRGAGGSTVPGGKGVRGDACAAACELLALLEAFPGGLTEAVLLTQLQSRLGPGAGGAKTRRDADQQCDQGAGADAAPRAPAAAAARSLLPLPGSQRLRDALPSRDPLQQRRQLLLQASVAAVGGVGGAGGSAGAAAGGEGGGAGGGGGGPTRVLLLEDDSTRAPVAAFVHSLHADLMSSAAAGEAPLLAAGAQLCMAATAVTLLGCPEVPPLLPPACLVVQAPQAGASGLAAALRAAGGQAADLASLLAWEGAQGGQGRSLAEWAAAQGLPLLAQDQAGVVLDGWMVAEVAATNPAPPAAEQQQQGGPHVGSGSITLRPASSWAAAGAAGASPGHPSGSAGDGTLEWWLHAGGAPFAQLLRPGELLALRRPSLRRPPSSRPQDVPLVVELGPAGLVVVAAAAAAPAAAQAEASEEAPGAAGQPMEWEAGAPPEASSGSGVFADLGSCLAAAAGSQEGAPCAALAAQQGGMLVCGILHSLRLPTGGGLQRGAGPVTCVLADGAGAAVPLHLHLRPGSKLARTLRDGHSLLLAGAQPAAASTGGREGAPEGAPTLVLTWREGAPGAAAADLSALPALLATPALQRVVPLVQLLRGAEPGGEQPQPRPAAAAGACSPAGCAAEPRLARLRLAAAQLEVGAVHGPCGRRVSFSLGLSWDARGEGPGSGDEAEGQAGGGEHGPHADGAAAGARAEGKPPEPGPGASGGGGGKAGQEGGAGAGLQLGGPGGLFQCGACGVEVGCGDVLPAAYLGGTALAAGSCREGGASGAAGWDAGAGAAAGEDAGPGSPASPQVPVHLEAAACAALAGMPAAAFARLAAEERQVVLAAAQQAEWLACVAGPAATAGGGGEAGAGAGWQAPPALVVTMLRRV